MATPESHALILRPAPLIPILPDGRHEDGITIGDVCEQFLYGSNTSSTQFLA